MNDVRGPRQERNGSGPQETTPAEARPVVVFGDPLEPGVRDPLFDGRLPRVAPGNQVALTFDDGPDQWTDAILDILEQHSVPATFFVLGEKVADRPREAQRIVETGCEIANHTHSHANLTELSNTEVCQELADCSTVVYAVTRQTPYFYRAPFLRDSPAAKMAGLALGMFSVDCDVVPEDWKHTDYRIIANSVTRGVTEGGRIVLLHDGVPADRDGDRRPTVKAVKAVVPWLVEHGYELVTVSQLLGRVGVPQPHS